MSDDDQRFAAIMVKIAWAIAIVLGIFFFYEYTKPVKSSYQMQHGEVVIKADGQQHFHIDGTINQSPVSFLIDTGATVVAVPEALATTLQLTAYYPITLQTASGTVTGSLTRIPKLSFATFTLYNVKAVIVQGQQNNTVLLGMNVLSQFEWTQKQGVLILKALLH